MKKLITLLFSLPILGIAQNTVCFTIEPNPNTNNAALSSFTKYVDVLGCFSIYAEITIPDAKVLHAASTFNVTCVVFVANVPVTGQRRSRDRQFVLVRVWIDEMKN